METSQYNNLCDIESDVWGVNECPDFTVPMSQPFSQEKAKSCKYHLQKIAVRINDIIAISEIKRDIAQLNRRCELIERLSPLYVPIQTFAPEPYILNKQINIVVRYQDNQYLASFFDANLSTSGDTQEEAVFNLKDLILATFQMLNEMRDRDLGPVPLHQKKVLEEFISQKRGNGKYN